MKNSEVTTNVKRARQNSKYMVLKLPIPLSTLKTEYEKSTAEKTIRTQGDEPPKNKQKITSISLSRIKQNTYTQTSMKLNNTMKLSKVLHLKEPIALHELLNNSSNTSKTFNVKTVEGTYMRKISSVNIKTPLQDWKQNALAILEHFTVYAFIHYGGKFKCWVCRKSYFDYKLLKEHWMKDHSFDDIKFCVSKKVKDHLKVDISMAQCRICSESVDSVQAMKLHLINHGKAVNLECRENIVPFKLDCDEFNCQVCGDKFLKLRPLIIHMNKHFNNCSCEICGSVFISNNLLKNHLQSHESGNFPCDRCDKVFSNVIKRRIHIHGVHLKKQYRKCPLCPKKFNSTYQRAKHLRIVHKESSEGYRCEICGRFYNIHTHYRLHMRRVHLQEKNKECHICHSRFFSQYGLSRHMTTHTAEKNFTCDVCGKTFTRKKSLQEHCKLHKAEFACTVCEEAFNEQASLIAHMSTSHGVY